MFLDTIKKEWFVILVLIAPFIVSAVLWNDLPDIVPTHFNAAGEADDWGPKWINALLIPLINVALYLMLIFLPAIDPKNKIKSAQKPIAAIRMIMVFFMAGVYGFVMSASFGEPTNISIYIQMAVGALILIIGNYINSVKPNYFVGIRTPWTLESPEVWKKTHRLGSKVWIIGGIVMMVFPWLGVTQGSEYFIFIMISILAGIPLIYSFVVYKQLERSTES